MSKFDELIVPLFYKIARKNKYNGSKGNDDLIPYIGQYRAMSILDMHDSMNQKELADKLKISPASLSETLKKLEKRNFIKKTINNIDKRSYTLSLSSEGKQQLNEYYKKRQVFHNNMLKGLDEKEKEILYNLLLKIDYENEEEKQ